MEHIVIRIMPLWFLRSKIGQAFLYHVYYRYVCPSNSSTWARDCVRAGQCGCNNYDRYKR